MTSRISKRALSPFFMAAAVASLLNCGGGREESFTTSGDTAVMAGVTGIWMGSTPEGKTYTLTLCENLAATSSDVESSCGSLHIVRGDGRGKTETTEEPTGCGGCVYSYDAFVDGTIEGDDLNSMTVHGDFDLGKGDANGPPFPYQVAITSDAEVNSQYGTPTQAILIAGEMDQAGVIEVSRFTYPPIGGVANGDASADSGAVAPPAAVDASAQAYNSPQVTTPAFELHRIGDAACPSN